MKKIETANDNDGEDNLNDYDDTEISRIMDSDFNDDEYVMARKSIDNRSTDSNYRNCNVIDFDSKHNDDKIHSKSGHSVTVT